MDIEIVRYLKSIQDHEELLNKDSFNNVMDSSYNIRIITMITVGIYKNSK